MEADTSFCFSLSQVEDWYGRKLFLQVYKRNIDRKHVFVASIWNAKESKKTKLEKNYQNVIVFNLKTFVG